MSSQIGQDSDISTDSSTQQENPNLKTIRELERKITEITTARETFLRKYKIINKNIESRTRELLIWAKTSQQNLIHRLNEISDAKTFEWTRQIELCDRAETCIKNADESFIQSIYNSFAKSIGFIDSGLLKFVPSDGRLLQEVKKFGKLSLSNEKASVKLKPKFIISGNLEKLKKPWGVCTDATGRILVTDRDNNTIEVFDKSGKLLFFFGETGSKFGEFNNPTGITTDEKCRIIISDRNNHRIQIFTSGGKFIRSFGKRGTKKGEFQYPHAVAVNGDSQIAVSDRRKIQLFNSTGKFIAQFFLRFYVPDIKVQPRGLAFDSDGKLLVADVNVRCVFSIDKCFKNAEKIKSFVEPQAVASDRNGMFAVYDSGNKTIKVFHKDGSPYENFDFGDFGPLLGICLIPNGGIIVTELGRNRVLVF